MSIDEPNNGLTFLQKVKYYFTELEFYQDQQALGDLFENKTIWTISVYLLASAGIFGRQITQFPKVKIDFNNLQWDVVLASFIFGLAILPFFIKRINEINSTPGLQQVLSAFGLGFFMDFTTNAIINFYFK